MVVLANLLELRLQQVVRVVYFDSFLRVVYPAHKLQVFLNSELQFPYVGLTNLFLLLNFINFLLNFHAFLVRQN